MRSLLSLSHARLPFLSGCERPFEPLARSDIVFSIYGHLEAASDTQWVRVMPIRESTRTDAQPIDAVVTLEELETGDKVVMSDSLTRYLGNVGGVLYAHNFFTTMPMVPGRHYRLTATRSDGAASTATVLVPEWKSPTLIVSNSFKFPTTTVPGYGEFLARARGTIRGTRHLGMLFGGLNATDCCDWTQPNATEFLPVTKAAEFEGDHHEVQLSWGTDPLESVPSFVGARLYDKANTLTVVASGESWLYGVSRQLRELSHPTGINNIEGGVGFLAGTHTYVFPFATCIPAERTIPCTITFSPSSATLIAEVTNGCTGEPLPAARVQLLGSREDGIRSEITGANGKVRFPGLKPGAGHSLLFEVPVPPGRTSDYFPVELANVVLGEAAVDTVSVVMTRRGNCPS